MRILTTLILCLLAAPALACGGPGDACKVAHGSYFAAAPDAVTGGATGGATGKRPVVVFFHGGGGWGSRIHKMRKWMTDAFTDRGYVVIGMNGSKRPGSKWGPGWAFLPQFPPHRDEVAFTREVLDDAGARFDIDRSRVLIAGFSIGGSMTSYLACWAPDLGAAFAPVSGGFWRPHPDDCAGPVRLLHTHGWRDQTVPLEGRPIRNTGIKQGDIYQTLAQWRAENGCAKYRADKFITDGPFWRRIWTHCDAGALEFALHPGGHEIPKAWPALVMDWFETLDAPSQ